MAIGRRKKFRFADSYRFEGFYPHEEKMRGKFGEPKARILPLTRRSKKHGAVSVGLSTKDGMTVSLGGCGICPPGTRMCILRLSVGAWTASSAVA
jgi:hypothetical protein